MHQIKGNQKITPFPPQSEDEMHYIILSKLFFFFEVVPALIFLT